MIKIKILDQDWKIYVLDEDEFIERFGDGDAAVTLPDIRECYFSEYDISRDIVRHELFHMYAASANLRSAALSIEQFEEFLAEMYGNHADRMLRLSRKLYKQLKEEANHA